MGFDGMMFSGRATFLTFGETDLNRPGSRSSLACLFPRLASAQHLEALENLRKDVIEGKHSMCKTLLFMKTDI